MIHASRPKTNKDPAYVYVGPVTRHGVVMLFLPSSK